MEKNHELKAELEKKSGGKGSSLDTPGKPESNPDLKVASTNEILPKLPSSSSASPQHQTSPYRRIIEATTAVQSKLGDYNEIMDNIVRTSGSGSRFERYQDVFYGLNKLPQLPELPFHRETQGLIFFTRPDLNLAYDNISKVRQLSHLLTQDVETSMHAIRMALDPTTQNGGTPILGKPLGARQATPIDSPLTDRHNPYLALLSNTCITMSQPPDMGINVYTSPEGVFREQWIMNDSIAAQNGYFDLTCTFANLKSNSVLMMFLTWIQYMSYLRIGPLSPHPHNRLRNRMDYFTRIERYKMDESGKFIEQWFHTGASVPKNISIGSAFGLNRLEPMEYENKEISVQFASVGAVYNDPIQLWEFNQRMMTWNPTLQEGKRQEKYYKVPNHDSAITNHFGYPLINLATREMEWWVLKEDYKRLMKGIYNEKAYSSTLEGYSKAKGKHTPGAKVGPDTN